jgi:spore coat protein CotH
MRTMIRLSAWICLALGLVIVTSTSALAQTATDVMDNTKLRDVQLLMNSKDLALLRAGYLANTYYPADMIWNGTRIRNVAVRNRGAGSRNPTKPGLRLDFNRYARTQQFAGYSSLILDNQWQDPSFIREVLTMSAFRQMGQASPRQAFVRLFINGEHLGVYTLGEEIDDAFVQRALNENTGHLYEFHFVFPFFTQYLGDDLTPYKQLFEPRNHELETDEMLYGPIRDLFKEINEPDDAVWRERVDARIDLPQFMTHVAIQNFLTENDGIMGYAGINNFYLHRLANSTKHRIFPWDEDNAFTFIASSIVRQPENPIVLFERAFAQPDLRNLFLDVAEQCAYTLTDSGWLSAELERLVALITPAVLADTHKQFSNERYFEDLDFIRAFASTRTQTTLDEIRTLR